VSFANYSDIGHFFPIAQWESRDAGRTWRPIGGRWQSHLETDGSPDGPSITLVDPRDPDVVYAVTRQPLAVRSRDRGLTWEPFVRLDLVPPADATIRQIEASTDGSRLWLLTSQGGLFTSLDDGADWESAGESPPETPIVRITANPHDPSSVFAITQAGGPNGCCRLWVYQMTSHE
jgi:photosystem II stability/assembly factor-like uncharacterized protein